MKSQKKNKDDPPGILDFLVDPIKGLFSPLITKLPPILADALFGPLKAAAEKPELTDIPATLHEKILASPHAKPGQTPSEAYDAELGDAKDDDNYYWQLVKATYFADIFGGDFGINMFGLPGWRAAIARSVSTFNSYFDYGVKPLFQRHWLREYTPMIPNIRDLARFRSKGFIDGKDHVKYSMENGFGGVWPWNYYLDQLQYPTFDQTLALLRRGEATDDDYDVWMERSQYPPAVKAALKALKDVIPPLPDLVTMAVREAFPVEPGPPQYAELYKYGKKHGLSEWWAERYRYMAMIPMDLRQAYENLWRGYFTKEQFFRYLRIADIHERDWEAVYRVAFRPPGVRELGYGYDTGVYDWDDIKKYRRMVGQSEEDAEKSADAMVAYRTEAEREALRREALADYVAGLDTEEELRTKLASIGGRPEIIDLWVARAVYRRTRDLKTDLIKVCVNDFVKGRIDRTTLEQDLIELDVVPETRSVLIREAETRRAKTIREEVAEKKKLIPVARVRKARDLGLIGDAEYIGRLVDHDYTEEDARLDLAIELTPRPVTPEELERRRRTVEARLNRATRVWERRIAGVDAHVSLAALQIEDAELVMKESLDVLDAQIAIIDEDLPVVAPERADVLRKRRVVLVQRREAMEARFEKRIRELTERHKSLLEEKGLLEKHRDEELGEYEEELKLLGAPAA